MTLTAAWWNQSLNVGDRLTPYLIKKITGHDPVYVEPSFGSEHHIISGSVLNHAQKGAKVWGAGIATITDQVRNDFEIRAVRGPLSRIRAISCGAKCPDVYGDPGLLLPRFIAPSTETRNKSKTALIPHYIDEFRVRSFFGDSPNVISTLDDPESFVAKLTSYGKVISSSLHGLVIAFAYGIPAAWVKFSDSIGGDSTKYADLYMSLGMEFPEFIDWRQGQNDLPQNAFKLPDPDVVQRVSERLWGAKVL